MSILLGITSMIESYKRETASMPKEIIINKREFDCLLGELNNRWIVRADSTNDPYLGIIIEGVEIGRRD